MQISARSEMKKQVVLEAQLEHLLCQNGPSKASHGGMLAFGGTKLLQEPNLCL